MKNKDLIAILESLTSDAEIAVEVYDIATGACVAKTCDIGYTLGENNEMKLQVAVETATA